MIQEIESRTIAKVSRRLIPFLIICYFVAYLDRVNVGFAALTMKKDLGLTDTAFGLGAGIFFFTYFIFEVPSNLILAKVGARTWIARIMFTWGLISGAMALIPAIVVATGWSNELAFYIVRLLLGAAEAGFFPGIIFFLTLWFPSMYRARIVGLFMAAIPASSVLGAPVSTAILGLDGFYGLQGWQWLFIVEALPALVLSVVVFLYLTDGPAKAHWLDDGERTWLSGRLLAERQLRESRHDLTVRQVLTNGQVWALAAVYFGVVATNYGTAFWLPQIIKNFGLSNLQTGFVTAIPYAIGLVGMILWGRRSDRKMERKGHAAVALFLAAAGIGISSQLPDPTAKMIVMSIGIFGVFAVLPVFWTLPTAFLSGSAAAAGIAVINAVGNLAGFAGPYAMGFLKDYTGVFTSGLLFIAALGLISMVIVLSLHHDRTLERTPEGQPAE